MRLDKFLANAGVGSRSEVKNFCKKGFVKVNDVTVKNSDYTVNEQTDLITVQGKQISLVKNHYYMLHKPVGVVSSTSEKNEQTVIDLLPVALRKNIFPVGRLDKDTTGLLLLTDDGVLAHELLAPKKHVDKVYLVTCAHPVDVLQTELLENGVDIGEDALTLPAKVVCLSEANQILLTIHEGKFHQVKRMLKAVGNEVLKLKRLQMGSLCLDETLLPGEYRELSESEIHSLKSL